MGTAKLKPQRSVADELASIAGTMSLTLEVQGAPPVVAWFGTNELADLFAEVSVSPSSVGGGNEGSGGIVRSQLVFSAPVGGFCQKTHKRHFGNSGGCGRLYFIRGGRMSARVGLTRSTPDGRTTGFGATPPPRYSEAKDRSPPN
jgi:hypothetical protein